MVFTYMIPHAFAHGLQSRTAFGGLAAMRGKLAGQAALGSMTAGKKSWATCVTGDTSHLSMLWGYGVSHFVCGVSLGRVGERQSLRVLQGLLGSRLELTINGLSSLTPLCLWELQS